jgi:hypothetical protein
MKAEGRFWQAIRTHLPRGTDRLDRIENEIGSGQPDVNGCLDAEDVWIELKAPIEPKRADTPLIHGNNHGLLISQINWFGRQYQAGGIAYILLRTDRRILLINGVAHAKKFNQSTIKQLIQIALFHHEGSMSKDQWGFLRNVIITASRHHRIHRHEQLKQLLANMDERTRVANSRQSRGSPRNLPGQGAAGRARGSRSEP